MKLGIYGGTFSPPHNGHIAAATAFRDALQLDKLLIIPAAVPPHKKLNYTDNPQGRFEMCRRAFGGLERTEVSDIELRRGGKSYTSDTLEALTEEGTELFLLCGTDMIMTLDEWHEPEKIFSLCTPVGIRRENSENVGRLLEKKLAQYKKKFGVEIPFIDTPAVEISSSELRSIIASNRKITGMVPPEVEAYIAENGLYSK